MSCALPFESGKAAKKVIKTDAMLTCRQNSDRIAAIATYNRYNEYKDNNDSIIQNPNSIPNEVDSNENGTINDEEREQVVCGTKQKVA